MTAPKTREEALARFKQAKERKHIAVEQIKAEMVEDYYNRTGKRLRDEDFFVW